MPLSPGKWLRALENWLWGYDFFISYHWQSGGSYAVKLAQRLRDHGYDVFLDRADFAVGDDWKQIGEMALRNTQRLILIATYEAIYESKPVEYEVNLFTSRGRYILPICFVGETEPQTRNSSRACSNLKHISDATLCITEAIENLSAGPSTEVIEKLNASHTVVRRRTLRKGFTFAAISLLSLFGIFASLSWMNATLSRKKETSARGQAEKLVAEISLENGRRAIDSDGDIGAGLLWYSQVLRTTGHQVKSSRLAARALIGAWSRSLPLSILDHDEGVRTVSFSPDSQTLVTGSVDGITRIWDAQTGRLREQPHNHGGRIAAISLKQESWTVAIEFENGGFGLCDLQSQLACNKSLDDDTEVELVKFSQNGRIVATAHDDGKVRLRDVQSGLIIGEPLDQGDAVSSMTFGPDDQVLATGSENGSIKLWDIQTREPSGDSLEQEGSVTKVAFSPDGRMLASIVETERHRYQAWLWSEQTGEWRGQMLQHGASVTLTAFSPDSRTLITVGEDGQARIWNTQTAQSEGNPLDQDGLVSAVAFSPDGNTIATGIASVVTRRGKVLLWDIRTRRQIREPLLHNDSVSGVVFSPDGRTIAARTTPARRGGGEVWLWNVRTAQSREGLVNRETKVGTISFSPDGRILATGGWDGKVRLWNIQTGQPSGEPLVHDAAIAELAFSRDNRTLVAREVKRKSKVRRKALTGDSKSEVPVKVWLWDVRTGQARATLKHTEDVNAISLSTDGQILATASDDFTSRLWGMQTGRPIGEPLKHSGKVVLVECSPDGTTLATATVDNSHPEKGEVWLWDMRTFQPRSSPLLHTREVSGIAFSPDGTIVATSSNTVVHLWNVENGKQLPMVLKHEWGVDRLAFSPNGDTLATGTENIVNTPSKRVRLWNVQTGLPRGESIEQHDLLCSLAFSPNGRILAIGSGAMFARRDGSAWGGEIGLWDVQANQRCGEPIWQEFRVMSVEFSPDGLMLATTSNDGSVRLWDTPLPTATEAERVALSIETRTRKTIENGLVRHLKKDEWLDRQTLLDSLGGDCLIRSWDSFSDEERLELRAPAAARSATFEASAP